jgi:hypothetical protein
VAILQKEEAMVPGIAERERHVADAQRAAWLASEDRRSFKEALQTGVTANPRSRPESRSSRRASLLALGLAGVATLAGSVSGGAKNKSRKADRKKCRKTESEDRCPGQVQPCADVLDAFCGGRPECLDHSGCCLFLETCDSQTFLTCLLNQA